MSSVRERLQAMPKVDAHHHLWDLSMGKHPWLVPPVTPRMYGDHTPICKNYLIDDFRRDSAPHNVVRSVHVQANWDPADAVGETRWVQRIVDAHGLPNAIVAYADLAAADLDAALEAHCAHRAVRGIRQILGHTDDPDLTRSDRHDHLADPAWERGYARLAAHGLSFDLQVFPKQLAAAAALAARHPQVPVVVVHTGFPWDRSADGVALWRAGMAALAALPHVHAKLSGPGMVAPDWTAQSFAPFIHATIELFGPARCMFASNVPPDAIHKTYDDIYAGFYAWAEQYSEAEQRALFHDTASRFYRL
jgi:predicted TIM-barrel fold metal-dependent hydrolase